MSLFKIVSSVSGTAATPFINYPDYVLKCYKYDTQTPMQIVEVEGDSYTYHYKIKISSSGLLEFIPHVDQPFDIWLFPTYASADANDFSQAIKVALDDGLAKASALSVEEWYDQYPVLSSQVSLSDFICESDRMQLESGVDTVIEMQPIVDFCMANGKVLYIPCYPADILTDSIRVKNEVAGAVLSIRGEAVNFNVDFSATYSASLKLKDGINKSLFVVEPGVPPIFLDSLFLKGNSANQTVYGCNKNSYVDDDGKMVDDEIIKSYAIEFQDEPEHRYRSGFLHRIRSEDFRDGDIYSGTLRNGGNIDKCLFLKSGKSPELVSECYEYKPDLDASGEQKKDNNGDLLWLGFVQSTGVSSSIKLNNCFDWRVRDSDIGAIEGHGIWMVNGGGHRVTDSDIFQCTKNLIRASDNVQDYYCRGLKLDRAEEEAVVSFGTKVKGKVFPHVFENCSIKGGATLTKCSSIKLVDEQGFVFKGETAPEKAKNELEWEEDNTYQFPYFFIEATGATKNVVLDLSHGTSERKVDGDIDLTQDIVNDQLTVTLDSDPSENKDFVVNGFAVLNNTRFIGSYVLGRVLSIDAMAKQVTMEVLKKNIATDSGGLMVDSTLYASRNFIKDYCSDTMALVSESREVGLPRERKSIYFKNLGKISPDQEDRDIELQVRYSFGTTVFNSELTAQRNVLLKAALAGDRFKIVRTANSTGPHVIKVIHGTTEIRDINTAEWCVVECDGENWIVTQAGTL